MSKYKVNREQNIGNGLFGKGKMNGCSELLYVMMKVYLQKN